MSSVKIENLVRMANQIGDFFDPMPPDESADGVATHLMRYWTPKMIRELIEAVDSGQGSLNSTASRGVSILKRGTAA